MRHDAPTIKQSGKPGQGHSTSTGRFISADPVTRDSFNRYAYVTNNPTNMVDPSGLSGLFVCGLGQDCQRGEIGEYYDHISAYWTSNRISFGPYSHAQAFALLQYVLTVGGWGTAQTLDAFEVGFLNTDPVDVPGNNTLEYVANITDRINSYTGFPGGDAALTWALWIHYALRARTDVDFLFGFSLGGRAAAQWLYQQNAYSGSPEAFPHDLLAGTQVKSVLLSHPFTECFCMAPGSPVNLGPIGVVAPPGVRVVVRNDQTDRLAYADPNNAGPGVIVRTSYGACGEGVKAAHCPNGKTAAIDVSLAIRGSCIPYRDCGQ